ncbi:hypothetical protein BC2230_40305 [Burkholderia cepacia]
MPKKIPYRAATGTPSMELSYRCGTGGRLVSAEVQDIESNYTCTHIREAESARIVTV